MAPGTTRSTWRRPATPDGSASPCATTANGGRPEASTADGELAMMQQLMDVADIRHTPDGTSVILERTLRRKKRMSPLARVLDEQLGRVVVAVVDGEIDASNARELGERLRDLADERQPRTRRRPRRHQLHRQRRHQPALRAGPRAAPASTGAPARRPRSIADRPRARNRRPGPLGRDALVTSGSPRASPELLEAGGDRPSSGRSGRPGSAGCWDR